MILMAKGQTILGAEKKNNSFHEIEPKMFLFCEKKRKKMYQNQRQPQLLDVLVSESVERRVELEVVERNTVVPPFQDDLW